MEQTQLPVNGKPYRLGNNEKRDARLVYHNDNDFQKWQQGRFEFIDQKVKATSQKVRESRKYLSQSTVSRLKTKAINSELSLVIK